MTSIEQNIIDHIRHTLEDTGHFAAVLFGAQENQVAVPRVHLSLRGHQTQPADDGQATWHRLCLELLIRTDGPTHSAALDRALGLYQKARDALRADVFRGGLTRHLPWGRATQFGPGKVGGSTRPPVCTLDFEVICHYETSEQI